MFDGNVFLEKVHIKNFLSLRDVELPLKPLTVLVGPNASGKSNVLSALSLFNMMMRIEAPPPVELIQNFLWAGDASRITFRLQSEVDKTPAEYQLVLNTETDSPFAAEELLVNGERVISIQNGQGHVWDENGENQTRYKSDKLALRSAGDYGDKPVTNVLTDFIKGWNFYDFQPTLMRDDDDLMRSPFLRVGKALSDKSDELRESPQLNIHGSTLSMLLSYWYKNARERFCDVSDSLAASTNISIDLCEIDGENQLCLWEGHERPIPLASASDGTLRLVAYYVLLNQPKLPPLIAIEEPERNLHPGALLDIAQVLEQIAERTQVIITTHSSQLLDTFRDESLSDWLGVLLLRNQPGRGTEVVNLEDIRHKRASLDGWIVDFGIGSAIFHSSLLKELMGKLACQA